MKRNKLVTDAKAGDYMLEAIYAAGNVIGFTLLNVLWVKPETTLAWFGCAVAWSIGIILSAYLRGRRDQRRARV